MSRPPAHLCVRWRSAQAVNDNALLIMLLCVGRSRESFTADLSCQLLTPEQVVPAPLAVVSVLGNHFCEVERRRQLSHAVHRVSECTLTLLPLTVRSPILCSPNFQIRIGLATRDFNTKVQHRIAAQTYSDPWAVRGSSGRLNRAQPVCSRSVKQPRQL